MLNDQRISEKELYDLEMKIRHVIEDDLEALSAEMKKNNAYPPEMWGIGKKNDIFRLSLPTQYGSMGLCLEQYFTVLGEIGRGNQAIRMSSHVANGLSWEVMAEHNTKEMKNEYLPGMETSDFFVAFTLTEPDRGSGIDIRGTAVKRGDKWTLDGRKALISFTDTCDAYYTVVVSGEEKRKRGNHTVFYVPTDTKRLRMRNMSHMTSCRGTGHGGVIMEGVEIPDEYRLGAGGKGLTVFLRALTVSCTSIGVYLLGLSQRMLELAITRTKDRVTFRKALIQRQAVRQVLADMATQVHTLRLLVWDCVQKADRGEDIEMISSVMRLHGIDTIRTVSSGCLEIFGRIGYFEDNPYGPAERLYQDARAMQFEEGPHTVQRLTLVRKVIGAGGEIKTSGYC